MADNFWAVIDAEVPYAGGLRQRPTVLTYSFLDASAVAPDMLHESEFVSGLTTQQRDVVRDALAEYSEVANIIFVETSDAVGDINFGNYTMEDGIVGYAYKFKTGAYSTNGDYYLKNGFAQDPRSGLIAFDAESYANGSLNVSDFKHVTLHEIGHTVGLKHPHDGPRTIPPPLDNGNKTVMSYRSPWSDELGPYDVDALRKIYGAAGSDPGFRWDFDRQTETLTQYGTDQSDYLRGTRTNDIIHAGEGRDALVLFAGDDVAYVDGNNFQVNGGEGKDKVVISMNSSVVERVDRYSDTNASIRIDGGKAKFLNTERIEFEDRTLALDIEGKVGEAYRLYNAAFDREPDESGLGYWIGKLEDGLVNLSQAAYHYMTSTEFTNSFGDVYEMSNSEYLELLYGNILDRDYDLSGYQYWMEKLSEGLPRQDTLMHFSESVENKAAVSGEISDGIWYA